MNETRPWSHEIPDTTWDYVVIGSGMGGMTSAALLAKLGRKVLVLEQHNIPGGFTQMFKRPGYRWDVGVHIVGEMSEASYLGRLLKALTNGTLEWEPVGEVYDEFNFPDGFTIQLPDSPDTFRATLTEYFPDERQAIADYLDLVRAASRSVSKMLQGRATPKALTPGRNKKASLEADKYLNMTTADALASLTGDPRLRAVLAAQWGYYGVTPARSSFGMHALMVQHFLWGAYYPVGGASSIARTMLQTVADAGGWTSLRRTVDEIVVRRGAVAGVRLSDGTTIPTKRVISAAGAVPTSDMLEATDAAVATPFDEAGPAHVSLYLGFKGDVAAHGGERYCQWYYNTWDIEEEMWSVAPGQPLAPAEVLFCSFPSLKDPGHDPGPEQRHTGEVITFVPWESFSQWTDTKWKRRGDSYDEFKAAMTETLLKQYLDHYPELAPMVDHAELSTPLSTNHFAASHRGSIYGLTTTPERFQDRALHPRTDIKGLFFGGVDASTPGIAGALSGGLLAAVAAEPVRGARFLAPIMKRP